MWGVLVAISIPIFTSQLEKAREATDLANIRSAYTECSAVILTETDDAANGVTFTKASGTNPASATKQVTLKQANSGWISDGEIAGSAVSTLPSSGTVTVTVKGDGTWTCTAS